MFEDKTVIVLICALCSAGLFLIYGYYLQAILMAGFAIMGSFTIEPISTVRP